MTHSATDRRPARVLLVHNRYRAGNPAGEDNAFDQERTLLERLGVEVVAYERSNDEVSETDRLAVLRTAAAAQYSRRTVVELRELIRTTRPQLAHFHNTFPLISTSGYRVCNEAGIPVVQTLHNYRLLCAAATLQRDGVPCELCKPANFLPAIKYRCYRSLAGSAAIALMLHTNWRDGAYTERVDRYIALTRFAASKFIAAGIAPERISIKPNFVATSLAPGDGSGGYVAFVGKLAEEKGLRTLLAAWRKLADVPLRIVGTGPLEPQLREIAARERLNVQFSGMMPREEVMRVVRDARFIVVPSEWYEGFPLVIAESYACATPVLAADIGGLTELVRHGRTGMLFEPRNPEALAGRARELLAHPELGAAMRVACREWFDAELNAERNGELLLAIYAAAIDERTSRRPRE